MTFVREKVKIVNGKRVRVTEVLSDILGLFGKPEIRTDGRPIKIFEDEERIDYKNLLKKSKKKSEEVNYGLGYVSGTNQLGYGYSDGNGMVIPLRRV